MFRLSKFLVLALLAALAAFMLSACGGTTTPPTNTIAPPTNTVPPPATNTTAPLPTNTTSSSTGGGSNANYQTYNSKTGNWSIQYPADWRVSETGPSTQFLGPDNDALVQVTYTDVGVQLSPDLLVQSASAGMKATLGSSYTEKKQEKQADGSTRIDFSLNQSGQTFDGQAFVEQRGTGLYILMLMQAPGTTDKYKDTFARMVSSYQPPAGTGGMVGGTPGSTGGSTGGSIGGSTMPATVTTGSSAGGTDAGYKTYTAKTGNWSISYPQDWTVTETGPSTQFLASSQDGFVQVTYSDPGAKLDSSQLVELASTSLKTGFGSSYMETGREKQSDGSTRLDFSFTAGTSAPINYVGKAFVEQRGTGLYILMLINEPAASGKYQTIFEKILSTYKLPADTGSTGSTGSTLNSTPSSGGSTGGSSAALAVGGSGTSEGFHITLNSVRHDTSGLVSPKAGSDYLILNMTFENTNSTDQTVSTLVSLTLKDGAGQKYDQALGADVKNVPDGTVKAGAKVTGEVAYEVPTTATGLVLSYASILDNTSVQWKLDK